jgi:hypothetical protein
MKNRFLKPVKQKYRIASLTQDISALYDEGQFEVLAEYTRKLAIQRALLGYLLILTGVGAFFIFTKYYFNTHRMFDGVRVTTDRRSVLLTLLKVLNFFGAALCWLFFTVLFAKFKGAKLQRYPKLALPLDN